MSSKNQLRNYINQLKNRCYNLKKKNSELQNRVADLEWKLEQFINRPNKLPEPIRNQRSTNKWSNRIFNVLYVLIGVILTIIYYRIKSQLS